jgi:hypothetical protein
LVGTSIGRRFSCVELRGRYPAILDDPKLGKHANFDDAQRLLEQTRRRICSSRAAFMLSGKTRLAMTLALTPTKRAEKLPRFISCASKCRSQPANSTTAWPIT